MIRIITDEVFTKPQLLNAKKTIIKMRPKGTGEVLSQITVVTAEGSNVRLVAKNGVMYKNTSMTELWDNDGTERSLPSGLSTTYLKFQQEGEVEIYNPYGVISLGNNGNNFISGLSGADINENGCEAYGNPNDYWALYKRTPKYNNYIRFTGGSTWRDGNPKFMSCYDLRYTYFGEGSRIEDVDAAYARIGGLLTGDLGYVKDVLKYLDINVSLTQGRLVRFSYSKGKDYIFPQTWETLRLADETFKNQQHLDNFFIALSNSNWGGDKLLRVQKVSVNPETDAAKARFISKGVTLIEYGTVDPNTP